MKKKERGQEIPRQTYRKPQLEQIRLLTEEAVLTFCKTATLGPSRPAGVPCNAPPGNQKCRNTIGS